MVNIKTQLFQTTKFKKNTKRKDLLTMVKSYTEEQWISFKKLVF